MKTSILVSGIAAFFLMITLGQAPGPKYAHQTADFEENSAHFASAQFISEFADWNESAFFDKKSETGSTTFNEDFSYLKFNVNDYTPAEAVITELPLEISAPATDFSYLKFNVSDYTADQFDYLKFNISQYTESGKMNTNENYELPVNEFSYLKFDLNNYINHDESNSGEITELPVDEFSYLKFDVNSYINQEQPGSVTSFLLPENE